MTAEHVHVAACRPGWRPWEPRSCEWCGALECVTGFVFAGCRKCLGTGGGRPEHPGHGPSGPIGDMRGPLLCRDCFAAWRAQGGGGQRGLGL
jgi:hypothetical protein